MTGLKTYTLLGADGRSYQSASKGQLGGHRRSRVYGRLGCPAALRAIARGGYTRHRVFFADEPAAIAAGYRPCAACCPDRYRQRKAAPSAGPLTSPSPPPGAAASSQRRGSHIRGPLAKGGCQPPQFTGGTHDERAC